MYALASMVVIESQLKLGHSWWIIYHIFYVGYKASSMTYNETEFKAWVNNIP